MSAQPFVERMHNLTQQWNTQGDQRAIFLGCYSLMTRNMLQALSAGRFQDETWVSSLLVHFADYYWVALEASEQRKPLPEPWRFAFDAINFDRVSSAQHLLLGVNAHISYDLVFALIDLLKIEWPTASIPQRQRRYEDYRLVNQILAETIDEVQDTVLEPRSRQLALLDRLLGPVDEWFISRLVTSWRESVWDFAVRWMESADAQAQESISREVEAVAVGRARLLLG